MAATSSGSPASNTRSDVPSISQIRDAAQRVFNRRACLWQCKPTQSIFKGRHAFIDIGTGMGKTLSFLIPPLLKSDGIQIIVTPLMVLGKQNKEQLRKEGSQNLRK